MTPSIEAVGLTKRFGKTPALDGLDLVAEAGQVLAVLGPNGAGKTTFIRAVATLVQADGASSGWRATTSTRSRGSSAA
jgi:ABC-2 type transport system ATP-binding protein